MNLPVPATVFDYTALPAGIAYRQRDRAAQIVSLGRRTVEAMGEIGHLLLDAQAELEHGAFLSWIEGATGLSKSSAYRFMDMARAFGPKLPTVGSLPPAVVQTLAAKTTPEPVRAAVLRRIEAGETIAPAAILDEVREARDEAKATAAADREAERRSALSHEQRDEEDAQRARGERGKAARERREARSRAGRRAEANRERARAAAAAAAIVERFGADVAGELVAMLASAPHGTEREVRILAAVERAREAPVEKMNPGTVALTGRLSDYFISPEDMEDARSLAAEIKRDGLHEPLVVERLRSGSMYAGRFEVLDGVRRFLALDRVLKRSEIPVRIAPAISIGAGSEPNGQG